MQRSAGRGVQSHNGWGFNSARMNQSFEGEALGEGALGAHLVLEVDSTYPMTLLQYDRDRD
eukprot:2335712-Prymnesium_polylepis.1